IDEIVQRDVWEMCFTGGRRRAKIGERGSRRLQNSGEWRAGAVEDLDVLLLSEYFHENTQDGIIDIDVGIHEQLVRDRIDRSKFLRGEHESSEGSLAGGSCGAFAYPAYVRLAGERGNVEHVRRHLDLRAIVACKPLVGEPEQEIGMKRRRYEI